MHAVRLTSSRRRSSWSMHPQSQQPRRNTRRTEPQRSPCCDLDLLGGLRSSPWSAVPPPPRATARRPPPAALRPPTLLPAVGGAPSAHCDRKPAPSGLRILSRAASTSPQRRVTTAGAAASPCSCSSLRLSAKPSCFISCARLGSGSQVQLPPPPLLPLPSPPPPSPPPRPPLLPFPSPTSSSARSSWVMHSSAAGSLSSSQDPPF
mmetsp:Transcript_98739/g.307642  ORF Transcript_98739/g.307642 Transcript_98739/m.307642 type:complete len:206 (+) Transcript_98739:57-674(+)